MFIGAGGQSASEVVSADADTADAGATEGNNDDWMSKTAEAPQGIPDGNWGGSAGESSGAASGGW